MSKFSITSFARRPDAIGMTSEHTGSIDETVFSYSPGLMKMRNKHFPKPDYFTKKIFLSLLLLFCFIIISYGQFIQQGPKLVGIHIDPAREGEAVAISADGNTAIFGGEGDNGEIGAAWVFTRSGGNWAQQGAKLVGTGYSGIPFQGRAVAISADGNTAIVGGPIDNGGIGAVWVFTRSGGVWTQQGDKLVGSGSMGASNEAVSVSLSADGNTAIVGAWQDHGNIGAAWVFTRSGGVWTQQGGKLVGTGNIGASEQGWEVALCGDGNTAIVGGRRDNSGIGAAWVYTRSGGTWTQQGDKLVGTGNIGNASQGVSVSLSSDGNTALVAGYFDNGHKGAVWVFTRFAGAWTQQGGKLIATGEVGSGEWGYAVSLSADGNTAIIGGHLDDGDIGATWVFTRSGETWTQLGNKLVGTGYSGDPQEGFDVSIFCRCYYSY